MNSKTLNQSSTRIVSSKDIDTPATFMTSQSRLKLGEEAQYRSIKENQSSSCNFDANRNLFEVDRGEKLLARNTMKSLQQE